MRHALGIIKNRSVKLNTWPYLIVYQPAIILKNMMNNFTLYFGVKHLYIG